MTRVPAFSVVVPTYERPEALGRMLEALANLDAVDGGFEVIVVDDGGSIPLQGVVAPFRDRVDLTLLRVAHCGPAGARQAGIDSARGRWLAFTDDDCLTDRRWLRAFEAAFAREPDAAFGGRVVNSLRGNPFAQAAQEMVTFLCTGNAVGVEPFFTTNNLAFPREAFASIGGIDRAWAARDLSGGAASRVQDRSAGIPGGEDRDLCARWGQAGLALRHLPEAIVEHAHGLSARSFLRQQFLYGRGAFRFRRDRAGRKPLPRAPLRTYVALVRSGWQEELPLGMRTAVCALIALAQVVNAVGFATEGARVHARRHGWLMPHPRR